MNNDLGTPRVDFDQVADGYDAVHANSIRFSGEETAYFAKYKIDAVADDIDCEKGLINTILDYGAGIGNSAGHFLERFPEAHVICADVSRESLRVCKERHGDNVEARRIINNRLDYSDSSIDIAFVACVFHHIEKKYHLEVLKEIRRLLRPGGHLFIFEHNPWNPLTQYAVSQCAFDEDAVLISAPDMSHVTTQAGFLDLRTNYRIFFPKALSKLRWLEAQLKWCPLGAQYSIYARA